MNCADCSFVFPNADCFTFHKQQQRPDARDGRSQRRFKSICEMRRLCRRCHRVVYSRDSEHRCGQLHQQQQLQQSLPTKCEECWGYHLQSQPCYIQPINRKRLNSMLQRYRNANMDADFDDDEWELNQNTNLWAALFPMTLMQMLMGRNHTGSLFLILNVAKK